MIFSIVFIPLRYVGQNFGKRNLLVKRFVYPTDTQQVFIVVFVEMGDTFSLFQVFDPKFQHILQVIDLLIVVDAVEGYFGNDFLKK